MSKVESAVEKLADAIFDEIMAVLRAKSFFPSERFQTELNDLIRQHIGMI